MFDFKINSARNALLCLLDGQFDAEEAAEYVAEFKAAVDRMGPGFVIISDLTRFTPTDEAVRNILHAGTQYAVSNGLSRAVRIVGDSVTSQVGNVQLNRSARELGYQADAVGSMREALELLGWQ